MPGSRGQQKRIDELERMNAALGQAIALLHRVGNLFRESLELEAVCYATLTGVTAGVGLGLNRAMMFFATSDTPATLQGAAAVGPIDRDHADRVWKSIEADAPDLETLYESGLRQRDNPGPLDARVRETQIDPMGHSRVAIAYRTLELVRTGGTDDVGGLMDALTGIAVPVRGRDRVHGVLYADNFFTARPVDDVTAMVFAMIADHTGRSIDQARQFADVSRAANTDSLTGLGHHGALMEALRRAVAESRRADEPLSLAMIDLDDFKRVNDTLGHPVGDRLLAGVSDRLRGAARHGSVFRYGGEEFAVLLPGADIDQATAAAERLRTAVGRTRIDVGDGETVPMTCSVGVATSWPGASADALIRRADGALLEAKRAGKNRVVRGEAG